VTDYSKLIDAETWAFIRRTESYYPTDTVDFTMERQREVYDRMSAAFHAGHPDGVGTETTAIALRDCSIPIRIYRMRDAEAAAVVIYLHGGGYVLGGLESHDDICAELCAATGFEVVAVDYRLAPEHKHPAAFEDALAAFEWAAARDSRALVLCGDSAGGNLAAAVSHATRGHPRPPVGQVLVYAGLSGDKIGRSYTEHAQAPMLTVRELDFYKTVRGRGDPSDPTQYPLGDADFAGLPPTVLVTAQCDPLSSDGERYRDAILAAGGKASWHEEAGLVHGYLRARHTVERARASFGRITQAVSTLGRGDWIL
jgi:acetyl esterase